MKQVPEKLDVVVDLWKSSLKIKKSLEGCASLADNELNTLLQSAKESVHDLRFYRKYHSRAWILETERYCSDLSYPDFSKKKRINALKTKDLLKCKTNKVWHGPEKTRPKSSLLESDSE